MENVLNTLSIPLQEEFKNLNEHEKMLDAYELSLEAHVDEQTQKAKEIELKFEEERARKKAEEEEFFRQKNADWAAKFKADQEKRDKMHKDQMAAEQAAWDKQKLHQSQQEIARREAQKQQQILEQERTKREAEEWEKRNQEQKKRFEEEARWQRERERADSREKLQGKMREIERAMFELEREETEKHKKDERIRNEKAREEQLERERQKQDEITAYYQSLAAIGKAQDEEKILIKQKDPLSVEGASLLNTKIDRIITDLDSQTKDDKNKNERPTVIKDLSMALYRFAVKEREVVPNLYKKDLLAEQFYLRSMLNNVGEKKDEIRDKLYPEFERFMETKPVLSREDSDLAVQLRKDWAELYQAWIGIQATRLNPKR